MDILFQNKKPPRERFNIIGKLLIAAIIFITGCSDHSACVENEEILHAESLIWTHPDSSRRILEGLDTTFFSKKDKMYWLLLHEHAFLRLNQQPRSNILMAEISDYFETHGPKRYVCEALYVEGSNLYYQQKYSDATQRLKEAEQYVSQVSIDDMYAGLLYYFLAHCAESEYLYHVAYDYLQKALPYFRNKNDHLHLSACYRDIARTLTLSNSISNECSCYFDSALYEAESIGYKEMVYDIQIQQELSRAMPDSAKLTTLCTYLYDSIGNHHYIGLLADLAIANDDWQQAELFLNEMKHDSTISLEQNYQYLGLIAQYNAHRGDYRSAYSELLEAYIAEHKNYVTLSENRTYAIARRYDLEREQEKTLRLTIERQRLWIMTGTILLLLLILCCGGTWVIIRQRRETESKQRDIALQNAQLQLLEQDKKQQETHIRFLEEEQAHRQARFRELFLEHFSWYKELLTPKQNMKKWIQELIKAHNLTAAEQWQKFEKDFHVAYGDIIERIMEENPSLSKEDRQYLMLRIIGLKSREMVPLIGKTAHTLWNRKSVLQKRIGTPNIDEWLNHYIKQYNLEVATRLAKEDER